MGIGKWDVRIAMAEKFFNHENIAIRRLYDKEISDSDMWEERDHISEVGHPSNEG